MSMTRAEIRQQVIDNTGRRDKVAAINNAINFGQQQLAREHDFRALRQVTDLYAAAGANYATLPATIKKVLGAWVMDVLVTVPHAGITGTFEDGETVTQGGASGIYSASADDTISLFQFDVPFVAGADITGSTSGAVAAAASGTLAYFAPTDPLPLRFPSNALDLAVDGQYLTAARPCMAWVAEGKIFTGPPADRRYTIRVHAQNAPTDLTDDAGTLSITGAEEAVIAYATAGIFRTMQRMTEALTWMNEFRMYAAALQQDDERNPGENVVGMPTGFPPPTTYNPPHLDPFQLRDSTRLSSGGWQ